VLVIGVLLLAAVLTGSVVLSVASFTSSSTNTSTLATGDLVFDLAPAGPAVDTSALRPGVTKTGQVTLTNRKSAADFTLGFAGVGTGPLAGVLRLTVAETAPQSKQLYDGPLAAAPTLPLGRLAQSQSLQLSLTFAWPAGQQDPALQGQSVPLVLDWSAST
jgi:hypothetical protein